MNVHASLEQLSSYLDAELVERERVDLEDHLAECPRCRGRLDGLRGVVSRLERLEQLVPPQDLAFLVERRIALEGDRVGLRGRLEETVKSFLVQPALTPVFGLVVALALILYLFSFGIAREEARGRTTLVPVFETSDSIRTVEGRDFRLMDRVWVERGLDAADEAEVLEFATEQDVPAELEPYAALGGRVRLLHDGRTVELRLLRAAE